MGDELKQDNISSVLSDVKSEQVRKEELENKNLVLTADKQIEEAKNLVYTCVHALCDDTDDIVVETTVASKLVIFEVTVTKSDLGKAIGKKGVNATAIRRILHCMGLKYRRQFSMEIVG